MSQQERIIELDLHRIVFDKELQVRVETDEETVHDYYEAMETEEDVKKFPPPTVYFDGCNYWLADGHHRYWAAHRRGYTKMRVKVIEGTHDDALLAAVQLNAKNGLRFKDGDKQKIVLLFLKKWPDDTNGSIAAKAACTREYVRQLRTEAEDSVGNYLPTEKRRGKDGTMYKARKNRKRKPKNASMNIRPSSTHQPDESDPPPPDATTPDTPKADEPSLQSETVEAPTDDLERFTERECLVEEKNILMDISALTERINRYFDRAPEEHHDRFADRLRTCIRAMLD